MDHSDTNKAPRGIIAYRRRRLHGNRNWERDRQRARPRGINVAGTKSHRRKEGRKKRRRGRGAGWPALHASHDQVIVTCAAEQRLSERSHASPPPPPVPDRKRRVQSRRRTTGGGTGDGDGTTKVHRAPSTGHCTKSAGCEDSTRLKLKKTGF